MAKDKLLLDTIKKQINKAKVVSFDIFDTLLVRPYVRPTDLFEHMEQIENIPGFAQARILAEQKSRQLYPNLEDISIHDIYRVIEEKFKRLKDVEITYESSILQVNPKVKKVYDYAVKQKKKICIISDMYLPEKVLLKILQDKGYKNIEKIYVSSTYNKMKCSGNLFRVVLQDLKIAPKDILHIGDNIHSDFNVPMSLGISAIHILKPLDDFMQQDVRVKSFLEENKSLNSSILIGILSYIYALEENNYWKKFGFKYAGPAIFGYMKWLKNSLQQNKIKNILFVARDGYTLQKIFNYLDSQKEFDTSYIYASRIFDILFNLNYQGKIKTDEKEGISAVKKIIYYYKNQDKILRKNTPKNITNCQEGDAFIQKYFNIYKRLATQKKEKYLDYLKTYVTENKVAMVDTCSIHLSSQRLLSDMLTPLNKQIVGYYWFLLDTANVDNSNFDTNTFQISHNWEFADWDFMEFLITAPEPPIEDIKSGKPVHKSISKEEAIRIKIYPEVSEGAVLFAHVITKFFGKISIDFTAKEITAWINKFILIPTEEEKPFISQIKHGYDSNHSMYVPICKPWFANEQQKIKEKPSVLSIKLFGFIPILNIFTFSKKRIYKFWGLPVWKIKKKESKISYQLLGVPLINITERKKNG